MAADAGQLGDHFGLSLIAKALKGFHAPVGYKPLCRAFGGIRQQR